MLASGALYWFNGQSSAQSPSTARDPSAGQFAFQVGKPGPGASAPPIRLPSTAGGTFDLGSLRGRRVLVYFQEGIMCQPCWDQLKDIESNIERFRALGIEAVVTITTDPIDALKQKAAIERLSTPVLSDPDLRVSKAYDTNSYGMMGRSRNGHTFIVLDRDGRILWRADYGGAPKYHMYVPVRNLIADLRQGLEKAG
ncbi:MAG: peroxiredoxin family protein [Burkholderiales bacterium]